MRTFCPNSYWHLFTLSQQSRNTVLFGSILCRKSRLHPQPRPRGAFTTAEKMRSRRSYSGINTKRRIDFLWIKNLSVWEKPEGFSLRETLGKHVLYIDFHDQLWKNIILHLIKTGIFRMKVPFTPDSWLNPSKEPRTDILWPAVYV